MPNVATISRMDILFDDPSLIQVDEAAELGDDGNYYRHITVFGQVEPGQTQPPIVGRLRFRAANPSALNIKTPPLTY